MNVISDSILDRQNFGNLYYSNSIVKKIGNKKFNKELETIRSIIIENKFDKKRYVDIYLGHDEERGFYGVISSKKQGVPNNPYSKAFISESKNIIKKFRAWLKQWNFDYSPKGIAEWKKAKEDALALLK